MFSGLQLAAAFAVGPSKLGTCSSSGVHLLLTRYVNNPVSVSQDEVRAALGSFPALMPHLLLIALANGIDDPFAAKVVEAYWIGNRLLDNVDSRRHVQRLIATEAKRHGWKEIDLALMFAKTISCQARPHHSLYALRPFWNSGRQTSFSPDIQDKCNGCRVGWGQVVNISDRKLTVDYQPLVFPKPNCVEFGGKTTIEIDRGFIGDVELNDWVAFHLGLGIDKITKQQQANLRQYTAATLAVINGNS